MTIGQRMKRYFWRGKFEVHFGLFCAWAELLGWIGVTVLMVWGIVKIILYAFNH